MKTALVLLAALSQVYGLSDYAKNNFRKEFGDNKFISIETGSLDNNFKSIFTSFGFDRVGRFNDDHHFIVPNEALEALNQGGVQFSDNTEEFITNNERQLQSENLVCNFEEGGADCLRSFDESYQTRDAIFAKFEALASDPRTSWSIVGTTHEGNEIKAFEIGNDNSKQVVLYFCAVHAREWITPMFCAHMAENLLDNSAESNDLLSKYTYAIVPIVNVDGYLYSMETNNAWRRTRKCNRNSCSSSSPESHFGVDPNRNFDFCWGGLGVSQSPGSDIYPGASAFDQDCTAAMRDYADSFDGRIIHFGDVHSYGSYLLSPISYTPVDPPKVHLDKLLQCNADFAAAARQATGEVFQTGGSVLYEAAGVTQDYFYGALQIVHSYTYEARGGGQGGIAGFQPPTFNIKLSNEELYAGFVALINCIHETEEEQPTTNGFGFTPPNFDCQNISSWEELDQGCIDLVDTGLGNFFNPIVRCFEVADKCNQADVFSACPATCDPKCSGDRGDEGGDIRVDVDVKDSGSLFLYVIALMCFAFGAGGMYVYQRDQRKTAANRNDSPKEVEARSL